MVMRIDKKGSNEQILVAVMVFEQHRQQLPGWLYRTLDLRQMAVALQCSSSRMTKGHITRQAAAAQQLLLCNTMVVSAVHHFQVSCALMPH